MFSYFFATKSKQIYLQGLPRTSHQMENFLFIDLAKILLLPLSLCLKMTDTSHHVTSGKHTANLTFKKIQKWGLR
jgi:hypothetical protein